MRYDKIDITKSKEKERVIRKTGFLEWVSDLIVYTMIVGFFPIYSGMFLYFEWERNKYLNLAILLFVISLAIGGLLLYSVLNLDRLKRIKGILKDQNREAIKELAKNLGWTILQHNQRFIVISLPWSWFSTNWGQQVVVFYDRKDILFNCTTYGLHDLKSPFHWFGNRKLERTIIQEFEKRIKSNDMPKMT